MRVGDDYQARIPEFNPGTCFNFLFCNCSTAQFSMDLIVKIVTSDCCVILLPAHIVAFFLQVKWKWTYARKPCWFGRRTRIWLMQKVCNCLHASESVNLSKIHDCQLISCVCSKHLVSCPVGFFLSAVDEYITIAKDRHGYNMEQVK